MAINNLIYLWSSYLSSEITLNWSLYTRQESCQLLLLSARARTAGVGPGCGWLQLWFWWLELMKVVMISSSRNCLLLSLSLSLSLNFLEQNRKVAARAASFLFFPLGLQSAALSHSSSMITRQRRMLLWVWGVVVWRGNGEKPWWGWWSVCVGKWNVIRQKGNVSGLKGLANGSLVFAWWFPR